MQAKLQLDFFAIRAKVQSPSPPLSYSPLSVLTFQVGLQPLLQRELLLHLFPGPVRAHAGHLH